MWCGFSALGTWEVNFRKSRMIFRSWTDGWTCEFLMGVFYPFHQKKKKITLLDNQHVHLKAVWSQKVYYCGNLLLIKVHKTNSKSRMIAITPHLHQQRFQRPHFIDPRPIKHRLTSPRDKLGGVTDVRGHSGLVELHAPPRTHNICLHICNPKCR